MTTHRLAGRWTRAFVVCSLMAMTGCSHHIPPPVAGQDLPDPSAGESSPASSASPQPPAGVRVTRLPPHQHVAVADTDVGRWPDPSTSGQSTSASSGSLGVGLGSHVYSLTPSSPLQNPASIQLTLTQPVPSGRTVVIVTRRNVSRPWTYLPATLESGRTRVRFATTQLGLFAALLVEPDVLFAQFSKAFVDGLGTVTTADVPRPSCSGGSRARGNDFTVTSAGAQAVYWCFGYDVQAAGQRRVLKVVNRRDHLLLLSHRNMTVLTNENDRRSVAKLSRRDPNHVWVKPRGTVTLNADLQPGHSEEARTGMNRLGQGVSALQLGVGALLSVLEHSGAGAHARAADVVDKMLAVASCASAVPKGARALERGCFSSSALVAGFGSAGVLVAPSMGVGELADLVTSEFRAIDDDVKHRDAFSLVVRRKPVSLAAFRGTWYAHTSGVVVSTSGHVTESIGNGCCDPVIDLEYQLSNPRKSGQGWVADATVTKVALHDVTDTHPPSLGRTYPVRVVGSHYYGVAVPDFRFCSESMRNQDCGA